MRTIIFFFAFFCCTITNAQWVWVGGTPGKATDWMEPRNWNMNRVPEEGSSVRIPQLNDSNYPEVTTTVPPIAHLEVEGGAQLYIDTNGFLEVDGELTHNTGILLIGKIYTRGLIAVYNTAQDEVAGNPGHLITFPDGGQLSFSPQF